ncbi:MAG: hypothetical protein LBV29_04045, partial [Azoarcus sp.]|nr:hypothetical protein [Azoarcus sp.]
RTGSCGKWANEPAACSAFHVGMRFSEGLGVQLDFEEATWWLEFAKKGGYFPNSMGSRISWSYPNIPPILLAGHLADRDYRDFLFGKTSDKSEDDISSILDNPEYFEIHLREDKNHFLVEIIYKPHENQPLSTFGAKYKIDKERIKISERVLFNE